MQWSNAVDIGIYRMHNCTLYSIFMFSSLIRKIYSIKWVRIYIFPSLLNLSEMVFIRSCILVMVTDLPNESPPISMSEDRYESDDFNSLFSSNTTSNEYVAMAISPTRYVV